MKITILGAGAAEGIPAIFCRCKTCATMRSTKRFYTRTQLLIDNELLIDFPPDSYYRALYAGVNLDTVKFVLITHSHSDHFYPEDFYMRGLESSYNIPPVLTVYGSEIIAKRLSELKAAALKGNVVCKPIGKRNGYDVYPQSTEYDVVEPYRSFTAGRYTITPLPSAHVPEEPSYMYAVSDKKGYSFLFACDTAYPDSETLGFLERKNQPFDAVFYDATFGLQPSGYGHMNLDENRRLKEELTQRGIAKSDAVHILTHISHNVARDFSKFLSEAQKNFLVACDGDVISLG